MAPTAISLHLPDRSLKLWGSTRKAAIMMKIGNVLIALSLAALLSLAFASPTLAKAKKAKNHRVGSATSQVISRPAIVGPIVQCRHGVWDPYGVRCDDPAGSR